MTPSLVDELSIFAAVTRAGNLTRGARQLGLPKSTVSRRLSGLEARLGVRLVTRSTQGVSATVAGRRLLSRVLPALDTVSEALREVVEDERAVRGRLRISIPGDIGLFELGQALREFVRSHREITLDVVHTDRLVDLVLEGFDVAVRVGLSRDESLVARAIGDVPGCLVASPAYLQARGAPRSPHDLTDHECLLFLVPGLRSRWRFTGPAGESVEADVKGRYASTSLRALRDAAIDGLGIARLPLYAAVDELASGRLVRVLDGWAPPKRIAYVVYPAVRMLPARVRALVDWLIERGGRRSRTRGVAR